MFISAKGYIGLAPSKVKEGDLVCILYGGRIPYILRPVDTATIDGPKKPVCKIVGDSYVPGLMYGEVITMLEQGQLQEEEFGIC